MASPGMLIVNVKRCVACKRCTIECATAHSASRELAGAMNETPPPQSRVLVKPVGEFSAPYQCRHCAEPPCVPVCPNAALKKGEDGSPVRLALELCAGVGKCVKKCPFLGIVMDREGTHALKCDLCAERLERGLIPACAEACPTAAITYKGLEELTDEERALRSGRKGAAIVRRMGIRYWIDPRKCVACRKCALVCPAEAIEGAKKTPHKVIQARCITCGACFLGCPADAIRAVDPEALDELSQAESLSFEPAAPLAVEAAAPQQEAARLGEPAVAAPEVKPEPQPADPPAAPAPAPVPAAEAAAPQQEAARLGEPAVAPAPVGEEARVGEPAVAPAPVGEEARVDEPVVAPPEAKPEPQPAEPPAAPAPAPEPAPEAVEPLAVAPPAEEPKPVESARLDEPAVAPPEVKPEPQPAEPEPQVEAAPPAPEPSVEPPPPAPEPSGEPEAPAAEPEPPSPAAEAAAPQAAPPDAPAPAGLSKKQRRIERKIKRKAKKAKGQGK